MWRTHRFLSVAARLRRAATAPLPLVGLLAAIGPLALTSGSEPVANQAEVAYRSLPALPGGSTDHSAEGVARTAIALAAGLHAVPLDALGADCPVDDLVVSWIDPGDRYTIGAHVTPIGPEPDTTTDAVNGIVVCRGSDYAYMGFEARWVDERWDVIDVPFVGQEEDEHELVPQPAPAIPQGPKPVPVLAAPGTVTGPIEGYAAYEPQRTCDPTAKVGTKSLAGALLRDYAGSRNLGIVRGCAVGGRSEHKEGRAFDWGVNITNPHEKAAAQAFIGALMATDAAGNRHALARRMGVMYLIFDRQIWSAYRASEGWRPYSGSSPHRDHVHLSLSWAGALGRTSFWSGTVPPDLPVASPVTANAASHRSSSGTVAATSDGGSRRRSWTPRAEGEQRSSVHLSRDQLRDGVRALWHDGQPPSAAEIQAWLVSQGASAEWAAQYAAWAAERAARHASRSDRSSSDSSDEQTATPEREHDDDDDDGDRDWRAEREAREAAAREARQAAEEEWRRHREERRAAEREARAEREAAEEQARQEREAAWQAERDRRRAAREEWERRQREAREARQTTTTVAPPPTTAAPTPTTAPPAEVVSTATPVVETTAPAPAPTGDGDRHRGRGGRRGGRRGG